MRDFAAAGFGVIDQLVDDATCDALIAALAPWGGRRAGQRGVLNRIEVVEVVRSPAMRELVTSLLGASAFAVRALVFDKTPEANWSIRWHQDHAIAVAERKSAPGFVGWSLKDGVLHVQAPTSVVAGMLAVLAQQVTIHQSRSSPPDGRT